MGHLEPSTTFCTIIVQKWWRGVRGSPHGLLRARINLARSAVDADTDLLALGGVGGDDVRLPIGLMRFTSAIRCSSRG